MYFFSLCLQKCIWFLYASCSVFCTYACCIIPHVTVWNGVLCVRVRVCRCVWTFHLSGDECDVCVIVQQIAILPAIVAARQFWRIIQSFFSLLTDMHFRAVPLYPNPFHQWRVLSLSQTHALLVNSLNFLDIHLNLPDCFSRVFFFSPVSNITRKMCFF